jgi:hypothetical protein
VSVAARPETAAYAVSPALYEHALRTLIRTGDVGAAVAELRERGRPEIDGRAAALLDRLSADERGLPDLAARLGRGG